MSTRKPPTGATRKRTPAPPRPAQPQEDGTLRVAGAGPVDETECLVTGCAKAPEQFGLCTGHYASRRGDGRKEVDHG